MSLKIKKMTLAVLAVIFFVILDRWLKLLALGLAGESLNLFGGIFKFNFKANYFLAFSLPLAGAWLKALILLTILILIRFLIKCWRGREYFKALSLSGVILGALSNLYDRLAYGYVIDYLDLKYFTVFNLADAMIAIGILLLVLNYKKQAG